MKKRIVSILLVLCMILVQLPVISFASQDEAAITGISITVDGVTYTEGNVIVTPESTVVYTVTGTNLDQLPSHMLAHTEGAISILGTGSGWDANETNTALTRDYSDRIIQFTNCDHFRVYYETDTNERVYTDIYLTFDPGPEPATITGLELIVDGVSYTEGNVIVKAEDEVKIIVHGTRMYNLNENYVIDTPGVYVYMERMTIDFNTATQQAVGTWFEGCVDYPITYTTDNWATRIDSGIIVTFVSGNENDGPAEITGLAINVDGVTYTEGKVIVRPESTVSFTVTGLNLENVDQQQIIDTPMAYLPLHSIPLQEDSTYLYTTVASIFVGARNYKITYTNDNWETSIATDIYVTYLETPKSASGDLILTEDTAVCLSLTGDLYIDLNGFDLSGSIITNGFKIYGKDSTTDGYTCNSIGYFTCVDENGNVIVPEHIYTADEKRYLAICTEDRYSFHSFFIGVTHMSLAPEVAGVGYKACTYGDEMVFAELADTKAFSFRLQLEGYRPVYRYFNGDELASGVPIPLRIRNYKVENYSEHNLYAQVSLTLKDGTVIETEEVALTFRWLTEQVNANHSDYTTDQLAAFRAMLQKFTIVKEWNIPNLLQDAAV